MRRWRLEMPVTLKGIEEKMLWALYYYGPLEVPQLSYYLARKGHPCADVTVYDALGELVRMGYISHISPSGPGARKHMRVYYLTMDRITRQLLEAITRDTICREFWWPATEPYRLKRRRYDTDEYLAHFQSAHERALRNFKLQLVISEGGIFEFWRNYAFKFHRYNSSMRAMVRPDALFSWRFNDPVYNEQPFYYFLELELTWKQDARVKQRMENYIHFLRSNTWTKTKSGLELPFFPAVLFIFPKKENASVSTGLANMRRHHKALFDTMAAIDRNLARWEQVFSYGFCFADFCTGVLDMCNTVSPVNDAIWYDFYRPWRDPCTLRELVPSSVKELLEERYRQETVA